MKNGSPPKVLSIFLHILNTLHLSRNTFHCFGCLAHRRRGSHRQPEPAGARSHSSPHNQHNKILSPKISTTSIPLQRFKIFVHILHGFVMEQIYNMCTNIKNIELFHCFGCGWLVVMPGFRQATTLLAKTIIDDAFPNIYN